MSVTVYLKRFSPSPIGDFFTSDDAPVEAQVEAGELVIFVGGPAGRDLLARYPIDDVERYTVDDTGPLR